MSKAKNFQIIIETSENTTIFETANSEKKIDNILDNYLSQNAKSVSIYERTENGYELARRIARRDECEKRLIGFGRW
jgi:hypothetical protein